MTEAWRAAMRAPRSNPALPAARVHSSASPRPRAAGTVPTQYTPATPCVTTTIAPATGSPSSTARNVAMWERSRTDGRGHAVGGVGLAHDAAERRDVLVAAHPPELDARRRRDVGQA